MQHSLFSTDLDALSDDEVKVLVNDFLQLGNPMPEQRPREGWRVDFKQDLSEGFFHTVGAFANTYGGVILLGVEEYSDCVPEHKGLPAALTGVAGQGELRTRIANSIATRVEPWPRTSIRAFPLGPERQAAVVTVEPAAELTMLVTGDKPVYVRDNDRSIPANARALRALLALRSADPGDSSSATAFLNQLHLRPQSVEGCPETFMRVAVSPRLMLSHEVDIQTERRFFELANTYFPRMSDITKFGKPEFGAVGASGAYIYQQEKHRSQAWYFNSSAQIGFATRLAARNLYDPSWLWSIYDCLEDAYTLLGLGRAYWRHLEYHGGGTIEVHLMTVGKVPWHTESGFGSLRDADHRLDRAIIAIADVTEGAQQPQVRSIRTWSPTDSIAECLASMFNGLIRDLGHRVDRKRLLEAILTNFTLAESRAT